MSTVQEIEASVSRLSREELSIFREWFERFDAAAWDRQLEEDITTGRLLSLAEDALRDLRDERCTDL